MPDEVTRLVSSKAGTPLGISDFKSHVPVTQNAHADAAEQKRGAEMRQKKASLWKEDVCPPTKKVLMVSVCVSSCWGEEIWKSLNIPVGSFPSPFGNRQQRLSGEISFALSQSEKFLRGILVLGKRNQTQRIPSGPKPVVKHTESSSGGPVWGLGVGQAQQSSANFTCD